MNLNNKGNENVKIKMKVYTVYLKYKVTVVRERAPLSLQSVVERVFRVIQYGQYFLQCPPLHHLFRIVLFAANDGSGLPHQDNLISPAVEGEPRPASPAHGM